MLYIFQLYFAVLPPIIDKGDPKAPITEFPPYYSEGSRTFKVGGNDFVLVGNQFTVTCNILQGTPPPTIMWLKDGVAIPNFNSSAYTVPVNKSTPGEAAGRYTCTATNEAGMDMAESLMRLGQGEYSVLVTAVVCTSSSIHLQ